MVFSGALLKWLKREKVLKPFKDKQFCGVHHFTSRKKPVRSYKVNRKRLDEIFSAYNKTEVFF